MKKILLSSIFVLTSLLTSFAQVPADHVQSSTGFSNDCDEIGSGTATWFFTDYFTSGGGGFDNSKLDTMGFGYGMNGGSTGYYIISLANAVDLSGSNNTLSFSISATGQGGVDTSFVAKIGVESNAVQLSTQQNITLTRAYSAQTITLTAAAGQSLAGVTKIVITMNNAAVATVRNGGIAITKLKAGSCAATPATLVPSFSSSIAGLTATLTGSTTGGTPSYYDWNFGDASTHTFAANASRTYATANTYNVVYKVFDACGNPFSYTHAVTVASSTTGVTAAQANIASSKVYPNPTSDMANVALELKAASDVKVTLTDLMGKEVMTIANGTMSSLEESFSVANLHKGIYTVNYFINGSAAKAEMLMVK